MPLKCHWAGEGLFDLTNPRYQLSSYSIILISLTDERVFRVLDLMGSIAHDQSDEARRALAALESVAA
jgi:hypothetical protein